MKFAVHTLRDQLTHRTRKPAVNAVLKAAYDEIQVAYIQQYYQLQLLLII